MISPVDERTESLEQNLDVKKVFIENINIKTMRINITLRIRGLEAQLQKRGALGFLLNIGSNFADITDAEFNFRELYLKDLAVSQEAAVDRISKFYIDDCVQ